MASTWANGRRTQPSSYTLGPGPARTFFGVTYNAGDAIPNSVIAKIKRVNALLSTGKIRPNVDPNNSRLPLAKPRPMSLMPKEARRLLGGSPWA